MTKFFAGYIGKLSKICGLKPSKEKQKFLSEILGFLKKVNKFFEGYLRVAKNADTLPKRSATLTRLLCKTLATLKNQFFPHQWQNQKKRTQYYGN